MKAYLSQCLPVQLLLCSLYASVELTRLVYWYGNTYAWDGPLVLEVVLIALGMVGQIMALALLVKR